ncbi:MAG TPA: hypothetical protein VFL91_17960 [Thermomicrobiales bacterium]|nr:hypothetical protein [Thermomicrobiales bacterium]
MGPAEESWRTQGLPWFEVDGLDRRYLLRCREAPPCAVLPAGLEAWAREDAFAGCLMDLELACTGRLALWERLLRLVEAPSGPAAAGLAAAGIAALINLVDGLNWAERALGLVASLPC